MSPRPISFMYLLLLTTLLLCPSPAFAQREDFNFPKWAEEKFYWVSSDSPIANHMSSFQDFRDAYRTMSDYLKDTESKVLNFLRTEQQTNITQQFRPCNDDGKGFVNSLFGYFGIRGFPDPDKSCITVLEDTTFFSDHKPAFSINQIYDAITTRSSLLRDQSKAISSKVLSGWEDSASLTVDWESPDVSYNYPFRRVAKRCVIHPTGSVRVDGYWYTVAIITNAPIQENLPLLHRQYLGEYIRVDDDGNLQNLRMICKKYDPNQANFTKLEKRQDTTTLFARLRGQANPSTFATLYPEKNPALRSALDKADLSIQQASDALAPSNLALLLLPVALNLVPIALLAKVTTRKMLLYTLLSDVLTVIPLAIKGVELIWIGSQHHRAIAVKMTGALNGTLAESAAAEMWASECTSNSNVQPVGIVFLTLAVVFMIAGIGLEFWARNFVHRRAERREEMRKHEEGEAAIPFNEEYDNASYMSSMQVTEPLSHGTASLGPASYGPASGGPASYGSGNRQQS